MGTIEATFVAVIDLWRGGRCRGMLVGGPQGDTSGLHGFAPGGGGGDHSPSMAATERRGPAGNGCGGGTTRGEGSGSRGGDWEERRVRPDSD